MRGKMALVSKKIKDFLLKRKILFGRFTHLAKLASGTPIMVKASCNRRYVVMTSAICASTHITLDLMDFHTSLEIVRGFTNLHGSR